MVRAERINQEGRILGSVPVVTNSILFNTTNADAVVSALQIFPVTHPWNEIISGRPLGTNSDAMIAQINADLAATRRSLRAFEEMNFVLVPDNQARRPIEFWYAPDESDLDGGTDPYGSYPIPSVGATECGVRSAEWGNKQRYLSFDSNDFPSPPR